MLPEEQELARLETDQATLEERVTYSELELETLKIELSQFQYRYYQGPGRLYAELDDWEARIAMVEAGMHPDDVEAQFRAQAAEEQARRSAEEAGMIEKSPPPPPEITPETKQAFRKAAKLMHPDRATTDTERERRNVMMAKVNRAYESGDLETIEKLIVEFGQDPEAIQGDDLGARMIKVIRRVAQLRSRAEEIDKQLSETRSHELYELMVTVQQAEALGSDPIGDLVQEILRQISERKIRLEMMTLTQEPIGNGLSA
ncbi:molecular chaperone DnaJ [Methylomonas lenta]|uniref:Molecular chaperone DnaJ n=1 Tax=Methylomonas lenta TaxID=980561 RepID=A0A177MUF1_9GAMM|nr:J domain-containing protein [Methylomonas lenta]OAI09357.1 molecular chaperone DnaJ [Methylomonas lenta]